MTLAFILPMPGCPSWNGRWSGEGQLYAVTCSFTSLKARAKAQQILTKGYYSYGWSDGWRAGIEVKEVSSAEVRQLRKRSAGFLSYDWMVDSILRHGAIYADHEVPKTDVASTPLEDAAVSTAPVTVDLDCPF